MHGDREIIPVTEITKLNLILLKLSHGNQLLQNPDLLNLIDSFTLLSELLLQTSEYRSPNHLSETA